MFLFLLVVMYIFCYVDLKLIIKDKKRV